MSETLDILSFSFLMPDSGHCHAVTEGLSEYEEPRSLRRTSHFCRLALLAALRCMAAAPPLHGISPALALCTGFGPVSTVFEFSDSLCDHGPTLASPTAFSTSVYNIAATTISMRLQLAGPVHTLSQGESSFVAGLHTAHGWLVEKRASTVLLGIVDEYNPVLEKMMLEVPGIQRHLPQEGALFLLLSLEGQRHGRLSDWRMGFEEPDFPFGLCIEEEKTYMENVPEWMRGCSAHPAGPVFSLATALNLGGTSSIRCHSDTPGGWWSQVTYTPEGFVE